MAGTLVASLYGDIGISDNATGPLKNISGAFKQLGGLIGGIGLTGVFAGMISEASEAEQGMAQLDARLASTKGVAGVTKDMVLGLADSLSRSTRFSDDAVISASNLALTFTNIKSDIFPDVISTALDMSTALGQDVNSSVMQLGKALQSPIDGMSALQRVGVRFSATQQQQIRYFTQTGQVAKAQKVMLAELASEMGGAAAAAGNTFAGKLDIAKNQLLNIGEAIGGALLPVLSTGLTAFSGFLDSINPLLPVLAPLAAGIGLVALALSPIGAAVLSIAAPIAAIVGAVALVKAAWDADFGGIRTTITAFVAFIKPEVDAISGAISTIFKAFQGPEINDVFKNFDPTKQVMDQFKTLQGVDLGTRLGDALSQAWPVIQAALGSLGGKLWRALQDLWAGLPAIVSTAWAGLSTWISTSAWPAIQGALATVGTNISQALTTAWNDAGTALAPILATIAATLTGVWEGIKTTVSTALWNIKYTVLMAWFGVQTGVESVIGSIRTSIETGWNGIVGFVSGIADAVKGAFEAVGKAITSGLSGAWEFMLKLVAMIDKVVGFKAPAWSTPTSGGVTTGAGGINLPNATAAGDMSFPGQFPAQGPGGPTSSGVPGFALGGYTGPGSGIAGVVHGGEYVVPKGGALVASGGGGGNITITGPIYVQGVQNPAEFYSQMKDEARRRNRPVSNSM